MDTKFSVAVHSLVLISESKVPINSNQIALSAGTNARPAIYERFYPC